MGALTFFTVAMIRACSSEEGRCTHVTRVWQELEYRIDVCRVTRGAHIENL
jgi:hypothetical protein